MSVASEYPQVLLQVQTVGGGFGCEGFDNVPAINPALITLVGTTSSQTAVERLHDELVRELNLAGATGATTPCDGGRSVRVAGDCPLMGDPGRYRVVVLVGDGTTPFPTTNYGDVDPTEPTSSVIPVLPLSAKASVTSLLPTALQIWNAEFYESDVTDTVPAILARSGLTIERPRIFISDRRAETEVLASQLFDALSHKNCDVFLDSFRIEAGVDFQARLTEQLGDKSMFVLLESPTILDSKWIHYEITKATQLGIGKLALQVPGGQSLKEINDRRREPLVDADFATARYSPRGELAPDALERITKRVLREHVRALFNRRGSLNASITNALRRFGASSSFDHFGMLSVRSKHAVDDDYLVWLSPTPPGVAEFFRASERKPAGLTRVLLGPSETLGRVRMQQTSWLSTRAAVRFADEGRLKSIARRMARGKL